jgi:hypothetical protein
MMRRRDFIALVGWGGGVASHCARPTCWQNLADWILERCVGIRRYDYHRCRFFYWHAGAWLSRRKRFFRLVAVC